VACSCDAGKNKPGQKYAVLDRSGTQVKSYNNKTEADAHAARIGGRVAAK
jgi:hypothetical protein